MQSKLMLGMTKARSGASESSLGIYGHMDLHGHPWTGHPWTHGLSWTSMDIHRHPWKLMESHRNPWNSTKLGGDRWQVYTFPVLLRNTEVGIGHQLIMPYV